MAPKKKTKGKAPVPQGSDKKGEANAFAHGVLTVLLSILIVLLVFGGAFYYVLKNNIYNMGEQFRPRFETIPVLRQALPPLPETEDPFDPKRLTQRELLEKYNEFRSTAAELAEQLEQAEQRILRLQYEKDQWLGLKDEAEAERRKNEDVLNKIEKQLSELERLEKEVARLIAEGNPDGFKNYFERIDAKLAQELYQQVVSNEMTSQELKTLAKTYESMEAKNAAAILSELGNKDMPLLLDLIGAMKTAASAEIIENMEPAFAADVLRRLADKKLGRD